MGACYVLNDLREETNDTVTVAYVHLITKSVQTIASPRAQPLRVSIPMAYYPKKKKKKDERAKERLSFKFKKKI
jgi:hypothetical protein